MEWLEGEIATIALCWRLERRDGVAIGLTAHDRDLSVDGLIHRAAPGMTPSAIERSDSLDADNMEATGALSHDAITEADLIGGRWDGARVAAFAVDWTDPQASQVALGEGTIGAVEIEENRFSAELRGAAARLAVPVAEETSPTCRATLGDRRCRVPMAGRRRMARVIAETDAVLTIDGGEASPNAYGAGSLRWITGSNSGLESAVALSGGTAVTLRRPPLHDPVGALVELIEGCDRRFATCTGRFANTANFQGEPHLPGIDLLTRYPGA